MEIENYKRRFYKIDILPNLEHDMGEMGKTTLKVYFEKWVGKN